MSRFLSEAGRILTSTDCGMTALQRVARAAVPDVADFCLIFLARNGDLPCVACAHATPEGDQLLRRLNRIYRITRADPLSTVAHVVRTGRARLRSAIVDEAAAPESGLRVFTLHRRLGARSALVVPIGGGPNVLGAVSLSFAGSGRRYTTQHVSAAQRLAGLVASFLRKRPLTQGAVTVPIGVRRPIRLRARA
jgi:GAF domain-containing protein